MKFLYRAALLGSLAMTQPIWAQTAGPDATGIAAVVNGQVITTQDVAARARLLALSIGLNPTPQVLTRLAPQVSTQLIDQMLEQQEINKLNIIINEDDVAAAIAHIEQGNNMQPGALRQHMTAMGIPFSTLLAQIRTQLGWQTVLHQVLGPGLTPSPGDMKAEKTALKAALGGTQYHLAEIFVPVSDPTDDTPARDFAGTVISQLRTGAPFPQVAAQFSQAQTALSGGDLGYVQLNQMDPAVAANVEQMPVGAISNPIRVPGGYEIVQLVDKHAIGNQLQTMLDLRQVFAPYPAPISNGQIGPAQAATINQLVTQTRAAKDCAAIEALNTHYGNLQPANPGPVNLATITPQSFQTLLATLPLDHASEPLVQRAGVAVVMVCGRSQQAATLPSDDDIANLIISHRVELESQQLLDILRHRSVIVQN